MKKLLAVLLAVPLLASTVMAQAQEQQARVLLVTDLSISLDAIAEIDPQTNVVSRTRLVNWSQFQPDAVSESRILFIYSEVVTKLSRPTARRLIEKGKALAVVSEKDREIDLKVLRPLMEHPASVNQDYGSAWTWEMRNRPVSDYLVYVEIKKPDGGWRQRLGTIKFPQGLAPDVRLHRALYFVLNDPKLPHVQAP